MKKKQCYNWNSNWFSKNWSQALDIVYVLYRVKRSISSTSEISINKIKIKIIDENINISI